MIDVEYEPYEWQIRTVEEMLIPEKPVPPYAMFIGGIDGWRDSYSLPSSQVLMLRPRASMKEVMDFVGTPMVCLQGHTIEDRGVKVYARLMSQKRSAEPNMIATWLLGHTVQVFAGPVVITDEMGMS